MSPKADAAIADAAQMTKSRRYPLRDGTSTPPKLIVIDARMRPPTALASVLPNERASVLMPFAAESDRAGVWELMRLGRLA